jgi:CTP synthase
MQLAVVEFARNVCGLKEAHSTEFSPKCKHPVINIMSKQKIPIKNKKYGGTMRLGAYNCKITPGTTAAKSYKTLNISERHRHRYELNNKFTTILEDKGMIIAGINPEKKLVEIIEIPNHPFFVGVQFHPEFTSQPLKPHPLFIEFIKQAINKQLTTNNQ